MGKKEKDNKKRKGKGWKVSGKKELKQLFQYAGLDPEVRIRRSVMRKAAEKRDLRCDPLVGFYARESFWDCVRVMSASILGKGQPPLGVGRRFNAPISSAFHRKACHVCAFFARHRTPPHCAARPT